MKRTVDNPQNKVLDQLLEEHLAGGSEQLAPSSGFAASVMESIQADATEPPPIAFPWGRVLPGALAAICGLLFLVALVFHGDALHGGAASEGAGPASPIHALLAHSFPAAFTASDGVLGWVLLAACLSAAAIAASFRLAGRSR